MRLAKGRLALVVALAGALVGILNVPAPLLAQSQDMIVAIPFDFHVGNRLLPSGTYTVHLQGDAIRISDARGHSAFVMSNAVPNPAVKLDNQLVFTRYGEDSYLSEVRWLGYNNGRGTIKTLNEIQLAKQFSGKNVLSAGLRK